MDTYDKAASAHSEAQAAEQSAHGGGVAEERINWDRIVHLLTSERAVDTLLWQVLALR